MPRNLLLVSCLVANVLFATSPNLSAAIPALPPASEAQVLAAADATKLLPAAVYFHGQSAPIQGRNSGGVRFDKDNLMLVTLVDTSGYSSQVKEKYQAYLITETALTIDGHSLAPGAYGVGFISGDNFIVLDLGNHELFTAHSATDTALRRPTPLQVIAAPGGSSQYRLYAGRSYVLFSQTAP